MKTSLLLMILLILPATAAIADAVPDQFELVAVNFTGVESVSRSELAKTLAAQTPPIWKVWVPAPILSAQDLEDDRLRIQQFYRNNGYYQTDVAVATKVLGTTSERKEEHVNNRAASSAALKKKSTEKRPRIKVTYEITEGPPVLIESIDMAISGTVKRVERTTLLEDTRLEIGQLFKVAEYEEAKKNVNRALGNRGYPFAETTGRAVVDPTINQAKLSFRVIPGPLCVFGPTTVSQEGPEVSEMIVRRALSYAEGDIFDADKVETSRRNLFKLDVFRVVVIKPEGPPTSDGGPVPMSVQLKSKDRRSVRLGVGYGTEDKLRLQAALTYRNLAGQGGRLTLGARSSALLKNIQIAYDQPYFLDASNSLSASAGNELEEPPAYKNRRIFTDVSLNRKLGQDWFLRLIYDLSVNTEESIAADSPLNIQELEYLDENTLISSVGLELARDTRNDLLNPKTGTLLGAKVALAPDFLGSELTYFQPAVDVKIYRLVTKNIVLAGRLRLESIQGIQGSSFIPAFKRLYLGGSDTVRGYAYQELPPLDRNGNPTGGQSAFNASIEARFPIYKEVSGVIFLDSGLLDIDPFRLNFSDMLYTCGVGLRYDTIIGPIRADIGYKLNPPTGKDIGDVTNPNDIVGDRWRFYLNIGQAF